MTTFLIGLTIGLVGGGALVYLFKDKGETVVADVKKDLNA